VSAEDEARIAPLPIKEWPPGMREAMAALNVENPRHPFPKLEGNRPKGLNALGMLANHAELATAFHRFNAHILFNTTLTLRERELLVLRVAAVRDSDYEWKQHVIQGIDAGLTREEIDRIAEGPGAAGWSARDGAMVAAVDELIADARISDGTWATLSAELDVHQLMDLVFTVGNYEILAMAFRTFGVPMDEDLRNWEV
jgi:alkylhydroperoxidase family enzyme